MRKQLGWLRHWPLALLGFSSVVFVASLRPFLGSADWAGWGQWVGGIGALFAALVALHISRNEAGRENRREAERARVQAYYVRAALTMSTVPDGFGVVVNNEGADPILDVTVEGLCRQVGSDEQLLRCTQGRSSPAVQLPNEPWTVWIRPGGEALSQVVQEGWAVSDVVVTFRDLGGTRWRRIGGRPPEPVKNGAS